MSLRICVFSCKKAPFTKFLESIVLALLDNNNITSIIMNRFLRVNRFSSFFILAVGIVALFTTLLLGFSVPTAHAGAFPGTNGKIVFQRDLGGNSEIFVMNADGSGQTNLTNNAAEDIRPSISGDGTKIAFSSNRGGTYQIYVMNMDGTGLFQLTHNAGDSWRPTINQNAMRVAYDTGGDIHIINMDGTNDVNITNTNGLGNYLDENWSPDGLHIVYDGHQEGNHELYIIGIAGDNPHNISHNGAIDSEPSYSPNGSRVVWISDRDVNNYLTDGYEIYTMNIDGTGIQRLTSNNTVDDGTPSFSPDGTRIAFFSARDNGQGEIYTMDTNGANVQRLTNDAYVDRFPVWAPNASSNVLFQKLDDTGNSALVGETFHWVLNMVNNGIGDATFPAGATVLVDDLQTADVTLGTPTISFGSHVVGTMTCAIAPQGAGQRLTCTAGASGLTFPGFPPGNPNFGDLTTVLVPVTGTASTTVNNPVAGGTCIWDPTHAVDSQNHTCSDSVSVTSQPPPIDGSLVVHVDVVNDNGGTAVPSDVTLTIDGNSMAQDSATTLSAGLHNLLWFYGIPNTYNSSIGGDCDASGNVTIVAGQTKHCTITFQDKPGIVVVTKHVINDDNGTKVASDFMLHMSATDPNLSDFTGDEGGRQIIMDAGTYGVDETSPLGYFPTYSAGCSGTVGLGETKFCTVTNDDPPAVLADLTVTNTDNKGGTANVGDLIQWTSTIVNSGTGAFTFNEGDVVLRTEVPEAGLTLSGTGVSYTGGVGPGVVQCSVASGTMQCIVAAGGGSVTIPVGGTIFVNYSVTANAAGSYSYPPDIAQCRVNPSENHPEVTFENNACNTDTVVVSDVATPKPDLFVAKTNSTADSGNVGSQFSWVLNILNNGEVPAVFAAGDVVLVDDMPNGPTYGTSTVTYSDGSTGSMTCSITLNAGARRLTCVAGAGGLTIAAHAESGNILTTILVPTTPVATGSLVNPVGVCSLDPDNHVDESDEVSSQECNSSTVTVSPSVTAKLTLIKQVINNNIGSSSASAWNLSASGPTQISGVSGSGAVTNATVNPGTYSLTESGPFSYFSVNSWSCTVNGGASQVAHTRVINAGENVVCTIVNDDRDLQYVLGGALSGSVTEGGVQTATGTLSGDTNRNSFRINSGANVNETGAPEFAIDNFKVIVAGSPIIDNPFDVAPPATSGSIALVTGNIWNASGGRATVAPGGYNLSIQVADGASRVFAGGRYNTPVNAPAQLRKNQNFSAEGIFDLIVPDETLESYGIAVADGSSPNLAQRNALIALYRDTDNVLKVTLAEDNATLRQRITRGTVNIVPGAGDDQIRFRLDHVAGQNVVTASYELLDNGVVTASVTIPGTARLFDVNNYAQASFFATLPGTLDSVLSGTYGNLTIDQASGAWHYELAVTPAQQSAVAALSSGTVAHDIFSMRGQEYTNGPFANANLDITVHAATDPTTGTVIITNTLDGGSGGGGGGGGGGFSFSIDGGTPIPFEADGSNEVQLEPGTHTITIIDSDGFESTYNGCSNIVVTAGSTTSNNTRVINRR